MRNNIYTEKYMGEYFISGSYNIAKWHFKKKSICTAKTKPHPL